MMAEAQRAFHFCHNPHACSLLQGLQELRSDNLLTDVILCVHGKEIPCHRNVLASCSEYFRAMFCNGLRESKEHKVAIHEVSPDALQLLVDYAYTSEVTITEDNAGKLLEGADFFRILPVRDACVTFISDNLSAKGCLQMMQVGNMLSCTDLEKNARLCALKEFAAVSKTTEFLSLTKEHLITLISSDDLNASEETVYTAVMTWINHDTRKRKKEMRELMELVRFPFMDKLYFLENVENHSAVRKSCQDILTETLRYQLFPGEVQSPRTCPRRTSCLREAVLVFGGIEKNGIGENPGVFSNSITMTCSPEPSTSSWTPVTRMKRSNDDGFAVAVLGTRDVIVSCGAGSRDVWLYHPELNSWCKLAQMNEDRFNHKLAVVQGKVYAIGGRNVSSDSSPLASVEVYDRIQNKWTESVSLPEPRFAHAVAVVDGNIYVMGGMDQNDAEEDGTSTYCAVYRFSPGDCQWQPQTDMPLPAFGINASVLNGSIYVATLTNILCYKPCENGGSWSVVVRVRTLCMYGMTVYGGKVYIFGGFKSGKGNAEVMRLDEESKSVKRVGTMAKGLYRHACVTILKG
ncbi:kelch-like protein 24 [Branchiostoma lanceolatum]|uniref:kelch-like protein 24 n=1 Tax=Branchiostoma lanceolatum TaxID=7740 RepID=UPI003456C112